MGDWGEEGRILGFQGRFDVVPGTGQDRMMPDTTLFLVLSFGTVPAKRALTSCGGDLELGAAH